jgi:hypothetical protein
MSVFTDIISRIPLDNYDNVKNTIFYISQWLYELNNSSIKKNVYKNIDDSECKDLYNIIELEIYNTNFSFTTYKTNKKLVIIYFIKYIYGISLSCAKTIYRNYKNNIYNNDYFLDLINNDIKFNLEYIKKE